VQADVKTFSTHSGIARIFWICKCFWYSLQKTPILSKENVRHLIMYTKIGTSQG